MGPQRTSLCILDFHSSDPRNPSSSESVWVRPKRTPWVERGNEKHATLLHSWPSTSWLLHCTWPTLLQWPPQPSNFPLVNIYCVGNCTIKPHLGETLWSFRTNRPFFTIFVFSYRQRIMSLLRNEGPRPYGAHDFQISFSDNSKSRRACGVIYKILLSSRFSVLSTFSSMGRIDI
jgi:hypothetical protein